MQAIEIHKKIDELIQKGTLVAKDNVVRALLGTNEDARRYFFSVADESWLQWLWKDGFFDEIKKPSSDVSKYAYRLPELDYLSRMAEKSPKLVTDIILEVKSTPEAFNPEAIDRFTWTATFLPAEELKRLAPKMRGENWVMLMGKFNRWGFEYEKILEKLAVAKDYESILIIAESIFSLRRKEDMKEGAFGYSTDNPFYFNDLSYTKVFEYLAEVDDAHLECALKFVTDLLSRVVLLGGEAEGTFSIQEPYHLYDVDFFTIEPGSKQHLSHRDDVRELAALVKVLIRRILSEKCDNETFVRHVYEAYLANLPDSWSMYRLRLYAYSLCPGIFSIEINKSIYAIFEKGKGDLTSGAEFERLLSVVFPLMADEEQRNYVSKVITWHKEAGFKDTPRGILSAILEWITPDEKKLAEETFGPLFENYTPNAVVGDIRTGFAVHKTPGDDEEWDKPITEIISMLKSEWSPSAVYEKYKQDDIFNSHTGEAVGERLKNEVKKKIDAYTKNATLFFDKANLDPHYTYSFFRGVEEFVRENPSSKDVDWDQVIALCEKIAKLGVISLEDQKQRERGQFGSWLVGWSTVNTGIADVLQQLLSGEGEKPRFTFLTHRKTLLDILTYLLASLDPEPKENEEGDSEPYGRAINSTRGRSFQAFVFFIYHDGKQFKKDDKVQIAADVMSLYELVLKKENTEAIYCLYGHYLASFYFRNETRTKALLPVIFPEDEVKMHLYLAAWEGYLTANLYKEMFDDAEFRKLYVRAIGLRSETYPKRRYSRDLDEGIAGHLALAYMHLGLEIDSDLFKLFWGTTNTKRQKEFISRIGRSAISRSAPNVWLKENPEVKLDKLVNFWSWSLEHVDDAEVLEGFGFWVSADDIVIPTKDVAVLMHKTLLKTNGALDWEYGLMHQINLLAKEAPVETLGIVRSLLTAENEEGGGAFIYIDREVPDVIRTLYINPETKDGTVKLVNDLLALPVSQRYWNLIKIVQE